MYIADEIVQAVAEVRQVYLEAYAAYLKAQPGRDLTIKQGAMQRARLLYEQAAMAAFDGLLVENIS